MVVAAAARCIIFSNGLGERGLPVEEKAESYWEAVESHIEAELKSSTLERIRGLVRLRFETGLPQKPSS
ncbi:hypothetical protein ACFX14_007834 [Malus domestica]